MTLVGSTCFSQSYIPLSSGGNCGREEGGSSLIWYDLAVVVQCVHLFGLLIPWFVAGNRSVPDCPSFRRLHVCALRSLFDVKLWNVNIRSFRAGGVVRRESGRFQFPCVSLTQLEFLLLLINSLR